MLVFSVSFYHEQRGKYAGALRIQNKQKRKLKRCTKKKKAAAKRYKRGWIDGEREKGREAEEELRALLGAQVDKEGEGGGVHKWQSRRGTSLVVSVCAYLGKGGVKREERPWERG